MLTIIQGKGTFHALTRKLMNVVNTKDKLYLCTYPQDVGMMEKSFDNIDGGISSMRT
jgi:hypothetical protein